MKTNLLVFSLVAALSAFGLAGCNRTGVEAARDNDSAVSPAEQDFMMKAGNANLAEIEMSRMAVQKSQNDDVKDYAHMIEMDHSEALDSLRDLMKSKQLSPPGSLLPDVKQDIDRLNTLAGAEFDREFINMMVSDHQKTVEVFRDISNIAQTEDVKEYASKMLPKLEMHLEKAQRLQSKLFNGKQ